MGPGTQDARYWPSTHTPSVFQNDGCLNFVDENDEVLISGFGRSGKAKGDIPGVRFKVVKVSGVGLLALWKEKKVRSPVPYSSISLTITHSEHLPSEFLPYPIHLSGEAQVINYWRSDTPQLCNLALQFHARPSAYCPLRPGSLCDHACHFFNEYLCSAFFSCYPEMNE